MDRQQYEQFLEELRELRKALGLPHGALPISPRQAFLECIAAARELRAAQAVGPAQPEGPQDG